MKKKIVISGVDADDKPVFVALELQEQRNKVIRYTFEGDLATDDQYDQLMQHWRTDSEETAPFPEGCRREELDLSMTENLLPEEIKTKDSAILQRMQTEWHFAVLASKLHQAYQQELEELRERVEALTSYDAKIFDALKEFWDKVQTQSRERNIFKGQADNLRKGADELFDKLKQLRERVKEEFESTSKTVFDEFAEALDEIENMINSGGAKVNQAFERLKGLQKRYHNARLTNVHRNSIWDRIDAAFKAAKERKFGPDANSGDTDSRFQKRIDGLNQTIKRISDGVRRDESDLEYETRRLDQTEGQLEAQIRTTKIKMIEARLAEKRIRLEELEKIKAGVEKQKEQALAKEAKRNQKDAERKLAQEARQTAKNAIEEKIRSGETASEQTLVQAISSVVGDALTQIGDTLAAVGEVAAEKTSQALKEAAEFVDDLVEEMRKDEPEAKEESPEVIAQPEPSAEEIKAEAVAEQEHVASVEVEAQATETEASATEEPATIATEPEPEAIAATEEAPAESESLDEAPDSDEDEQKDA